MPDRVPKSRAVYGGPQPKRESGGSCYRLHQPAVRLLFRVQQMGRLHHGRGRSVVGSGQLGQPRLEMEVRAELCSQEETGPFLPFFSLVILSAVIEAIPEVKEAFYG